MEVRVPQHEHPLHLRDLVLEYEDYEDEHEGEVEDIIIPQDFRSTCKVCEEEINWLQRYFYECVHRCGFTLHKFCVEHPTTINHKLHNAHTLTLFPKWKGSWSCDVCHTDYPPEKSGYGCMKCNFFTDIRCAMATTEYQIIHHPSHPHPLVPLSRSILSKCDACGEKHEGIFYLCTMCFGVFIHRDCAFLPKKLFIQEITNNSFSHRHPLTVSYSFPEAHQVAKRRPRCRVCGIPYYDENLWILKCEKCHYYTHLICATSGGDASSILESGRCSPSSFGKPGKIITKNFEDSDYPDLLRLPFPTVSDSILKHMFSNHVIGRENFKIEDRNLLEHNCHPHPLILVRTESMPSSSTTIVLSCHDPMKKIELLCNGCLRPITSIPFYKCANEDNKCDFVIHEWCTRLPDQLQNYPDHQQHPLILQPNAPNKFFSVFVCAVCRFSCNGFVYSCLQCDYHIDVKCAFIPEKITHEAHAGHLMSRVETKNCTMRCRVCHRHGYDSLFSFFCDTCDVRVHVSCAMLLPQEVRHKYDKHPMSISYYPIENHKGDYFCEICETEFNPERCFYHCYQCARSIHTYCAPQILQSERAAKRSWLYLQGLYRFVNIKFGGKHNIKDHPHPLIFDQGIESDGHCSRCGNYTLEAKMIFKCQQCKYAIDLDCCKLLSS